LNSTLLRNHPAWQLLSATKGPLVINILSRLFQNEIKGIEFDSAVLDLAQLLLSEKEKGNLECSDNVQQEARREIRYWIKRGLLQERQGVILATDALESVFRFVHGLSHRIMSSSASRLAIVQREIEQLELSLNPNPDTRARFLKNKIAELEHELKQVEEGIVETLPELQGVESIREIYALSTSLLHDFRRVEDSYRQADKNLRQSIISEKNHRGDIVDKLLDSHEQLLETDEGRVFNGFNQQLGRSEALTSMKQQLRQISRHPFAHKALNSEQQGDLRWLIMRLVGESGRVVKARARSEKDVRSFLKTGLAAEHHRVGELLKELFAQAAKVDWSKQNTRRSTSPLPPLGLVNNALPLVERLRFKEWSSEQDDDLDLLPQDGRLSDVNDDFWESFDSLDQTALLEDTYELFENNDDTLSIAQIVKVIPPSHDLEAIALWMSMAMASDTVDETLIEEFELLGAKDSKVRFTLPKVALNKAALEQMDFEV